MSSKKKEHVNFVKIILGQEKHEFIAASLGIVFIIAVVLFRDAAKFEKLQKLFSDKLFLFSTLLIIIFSAYTFNVPHMNNKNIMRFHTATKQGILGFIIAIMAYLDLKAAPFWIIWLASYYIVDGGG